MIQEQQKYFLGIALKLGMPLASKFFEIRPGEVLHYLDFGKGVDNVIVCVHGNPSWSWYFRHLFKAKLPFRIIALDHLGMGLSTKVNRFVSVSEHAENLKTLLNHLQIKSVNLVVHDWGGVIGLKAINESTIKLRSIIGMNTAFFSKKNLPFRIYATTRKLWSDFLHQKIGLFSYSAIYMTTNDPLSQKAKQGYLLPYQQQQHRKTIANFLAEIPWDKNDKNFSMIEEIEKKLKQLDIPMMAIWGMRDFCFDESYVDYWKKINPKLKVHKFYDAGHWCLEDKKLEILNLVSDFWHKL